MSFKFKDPKAEAKMKEFLPQIPVIETKFQMVDGQHWSDQRSNLVNYSTLCYGNTNADKATSKSSFPWALVAVLAAVAIAGGVIIKKVVSSRRIV